MQPPPESKNTSHELAPRGSWKSSLVRASGQPVTRRAPQALAVLLVDCSESMEGVGLEQAREGAARFARDSIQKGYEIGVVSFGSEARVLTSPTRDLAVINRQLQGLTLDGSTNMTDALRHGAGLMTHTLVNRVLCLVTDGYPNDADSTLREAERIKRLNITILTIGTEDADHALLRRIASGKELARLGSTRRLSLDMQQAVELLPAPGAHT